MEIPVRLLGDEFIASLESMTYNEALFALYDNNFGGGIADSADAMIDYEHDLSLSACRLLCVCLAAECGITLNMAVGQIKDRYLSDSLGIESDDFEQLPLPKYIRAKASKIMQGEDVLYKLDVMFYEYMLKSKIPFLRRYYGTYCDYTNMMSIYAEKHMGADKKLLPWYVLSEDIFSLNTEQLRDTVGDMYEGAVMLLDEEDGLSAMQALRDEKMYELAQDEIKKHSEITYPICLYLLKERELMVIRKLLASKYVAEK